MERRLRHRNASLKPPRTACSASTAKPWCTASRRSPGQRGQTLASRPGHGDHGPIRQRYRGDRPRQRPWFQRRNSARPLPGRPLWPGDHEGAGGAGLGPLRESAAPPAPAPRSSYGSRLCWSMSRRVWRERPPGAQCPCPAAGDGPARPSTAPGPRRTGRWAGERPWPGAAPAPPTRSRPLHRPNALPAPRPSGRCPPSAAHHPPQAPGGGGDRDRPGHADASDGGR